MELIKAATAGTLESSDAQVSVEPQSGEVALEISSSVMNQYGRQIRATVLDVVGRLGVTGARISVVDRGALDCTIRARVECALCRAAGISESGVKWGGDIR